MTRRLLVNNQPLNMEPAKDCLDTIVVSDIYLELLLVLSGIEGSCIYQRKGAVNELLSSMESVLLNRILDVGEKYCKINRFMKNITDEEICDNTVGLYMLSFVEHLDTCLNPYREELIDLEGEEPSLTTLHSRIYPYSDLLNGLSNLINDVRIHRLKGVGILQKVYENLNVSTGTLKTALNYISLKVSQHLFNQLKSWLLYGEITDTKKEFFISKIDAVDQSPFDQYCLNYDLLPNFIGAVLAEKILSVGQTVLFLRSGTNFTKKDHLLIDANGVAGEKAVQFANALEEATHEETWRQWGLVESVVDAIAGAATSQLHTVALSEANLVEQLHMLKNLFLMGRGELFQAFVSQTDGKGPHSFPDLNVVLLNCARNVHIKEESLRPFRLELCRTEGIVSFNYNTPWPLQLLFTKDSISSYNHIFRFLLRLKIIQVRMVNVWLHNKSKRKTMVGSKRMQLQQNLWFLVNNLQYYLQVDVLDCQFVTLLDAVSSSKDFDEIRAAHSKFLSNLIIQSFLDNPKNSSGIVNPVQQRMSTILKLCEEYCRKAESLDEEMGDDVVDALSDQFEACFDCLFAFLAAMKKHAGHPCSRPLSQLLLRLDFNYYFSQKGNNTASVAAQFL